MPRTLQSRRLQFDWKLLPTIVALAWPTMLEQILQTAVQYIDTAMVGSLGTDATAAVGSTGTVGWLVASTIGSLSVGFLTFIAQAYGAGDKQRASRVSSQAALVVLVMGILMTIVTSSISPFVPKWMQVEEHIQSMASSYFFILFLPMLPRAASFIFGTVLRAAGDTKTPMKIGLLVNIVNVVLNFFMIFDTRTMHVFGLHIPMWGCGWGVVGAAIASAISLTVGGILITIKVYQHPDISFKGQKLRPDWDILRPCMKIALPNALQRFGTSLGFVAFAAMINSLGGVSTATHTIANTVESAFYIPGYGMMTAASTLVGNALGAGDKQRMRNMAALIIFIEVVLMIFTGGLLFLFAPQMMSLFSQSDEVIGLGSIVLRMVALSEPFYGVSIIIEGILQGVGETKKPFVYNITGMWGIRIIGTFICTQLLGFGLVSAWACMISHNLLVFTLYTILYVRGKWNPLNAKA